MTVAQKKSKGASMACDPEKGGDGGCTACTPGQGADEVYGIYAGAIRDGVANCADYLDRISRQLEARPSRHYVAEKAQALRAAAGGLVGACHDVEIWLRYCGKPVPFGDSGFTDECVLPAGHGGEHQADVAPSALEVARRGADGLAAVATELADVLGWLVHDPGRLGNPAELEELGRTYQKSSAGRWIGSRPCCQRFARRKTSRRRMCSSTAVAKETRRRNSSAPRASSRRTASRPWPSTCESGGTEWRVAPGAREEVVTEGCCRWSEEKARRDRAGLSEA